MATGNKYKSLTQLNAALEKLVFKNTEFKVTADKIQQSLKNITETLYYNVTRVPEVTDYTKTEVCDVCGIWEGSIPSEDGNVYSPNFKMWTGLKIYNKIRDTELNIGNGKSGIISLTNPPYNRPDGTPVYIKTKIRTVDHVLPEMRTEDINLDLPYKSGTIALLSDIPEGNISVEEYPDTFGSSYYLTGIKWNDDLNKFYYNKTGIRFRRTRKVDETIETLTIGGSENGLTDKEGIRGAIVLKTNTSDGSSHASNESYILSKKFSEYQTGDSTISYFELPILKNDDSTQTIATEKYVDTEINSTKTYVNNELDNLSEDLESSGRTVPFNTSSGYSTSPVMMMMQPTQTATTIPEGWQQAGTSQGSGVMAMWGKIADAMISSSQISGVKIVFIERVPY